MRYIMAHVNDSICIGKQGENNAATVQFDVSGWKEMYGNGSFSLLHQRSGDMSAYPCTITSDENTVSWVVTSTDVYYVGNGKAQLLYIVNETVAKSVVFTTITSQSLNAGDAPDPEPEWITDVINAGLDAEAYAVGERNGNPVEEGDPAYHNNAKYWAGQAEGLSELTRKLNMLNNEAVVGSPALTERVPEGTLLKNQLWANEVVAQVGFAYDTDIGQLQIFAIFGTHIPSDWTFKTYRILVKDSPDPATELTLEDTDKISLITPDADIYKYRANTSTLQHHIDIRFCRVLFDGNGDEVERLYSAQYRYTVENGIATRTRLNIAPNNQNHIVDIGLTKPSSSVRATFNYRLDRHNTLLPLVGVPQPVQYRFIIPDSMFSGATYGLAISVDSSDGWRYIGPSFYKAEDKVGELEEEVFSAIDANQAEFYAENFLGAPALTERVEGGTLLKNQLWVNKTVSHVGFAYDQDAGKLWFYAIFGYAYKAGWTNKSYVIICKDSPDPARELTLADTDYVNEIQNPEWIMKYRAGSTTINHHADVRYCRIVYDNDGNEVDRIYSAQYRFTIENGAATRTRFETAPTDPSHIIDIGLLKNNNSVAESFAYSDPTITRVIQPLVSTIQTAAFQFIIPDSMFDGADHGLSVVALTGDLNRFVAATFHKAEVKFPPTLPTGDGTYVSQLVIQNGIPTFYWVQIV